MGIAGRAREVMLARDRGCAHWPVSVPQIDAGRAGRATRYRPAGALS
jgi:hypothetical protein